MTNPRTRTIPALLAIGLAAIVALPAATALELASQGTGAASAAYNSAARLGGGEYTCMSTDCQRLGGSVASQGRAAAKASASASAQVDAQPAVDAAMDAAAKARAEAEARVKQALELKERIRADITVRKDLRTEGSADATLDSSADAGANVGLDGLLTVKPRPARVDFEGAKAAKAEVSAKAEAEAKGAVDMLARLLGELQGKVEMSANAAVNAATSLGGHIQGALGIVTGTKVDVHHELDATVGLGAVPRVDVPRIDPPRADLSGSAEVAAEAAATAKGLVRS